MSLYLTTADPEVLDVIASNQAGLQDLKERGHAWALERGCDEFYMNGFAGKVYVSGLPTAPDGFGRWTKPQRGVCHPYRNNETESEILGALTFTAAKVPGLPGAVHSVSEDGRSYMMWPQPFVSGDRAWIGYSHQPEQPASELFGPQWEECLASRFHAAREALVAQQRAAS